MRKTDNMKMLKKAVDKILGYYGYKIKAIEEEKTIKEESPYALYSYMRKDGTIDYDKYRIIQQEGNKRKIGKVFVIEENIEFLSEYIKTIIPKPQFGICHGTRCGKEQEWFRKYLGCEVIGTEISDTAANYPYTIQWDFHEVKPEWLNAADFIYSNSFDHAYDPEKCLNAWIKCLRRGGICILEHSSEHDKGESNELDPFGADIQIMPYLITKWGNGEYSVRQLLVAPKKWDSLDHLHFIVIQKYT